MKLFFALPLFGNSMIRLLHTDCIWRTSCRCGIMNMLFSSNWNEPTTPPPPFPVSLHRLELHVYRRIWLGIACFLTETQMYFQRVLKNSFIVKIFTQILHYFALFWTDITHRWMCQVMWWACLEWNDERRLTLEWGECVEVGFLGRGLDPL